MITLLRTIKKNSNCNSEIGYTEEDIYNTPYLTIIPISENWKYNLLGENRDKIINFKMSYFLDNVEDYDILVEKGIEELKKLITNEEIKKQITKFLNTEIRVKNLEEDTIICITANITLELRRK